MRRLHILTFVALLAAPSLAEARRFGPPVPVPAPGFVPPAPHLYTPPGHVRVGIAPPPLRVEVRPLAPSSRHVWVPGYWVWEGGRHVWIGGAWAVPPVANEIWVAPRWVNEGGQWVFVAGHWGSPATMVAPEVPGVEVEMAPPAPQVEAVPVAPSAQHVWIPGFWGWQGGRHVWIAGHYELRPTGGYEWEPAHWVRAGHHWRFMPGHWRR